MRKFLTNFIKYNKFIYFMYYYTLSLMINILKLFVRPNDKMILFNSYAGRKYDDSPKAIFEQMKTDERFKNWRFVWALHNPDGFEINGAEKIKTDSFKYFITALQARVWVTNSSVERGLSFKGKHTLYFNTWHGTPIKLMGTDVPSENASFKTKSENKIDVMNSQGKFETAIYSRVFGIEPDNFLECGLPRNDELANYTAEKRNAIKIKNNIPLSKKVILYAPTFREFERDSMSGCVMAPPMNIENWRKALGDEYVLLVRAHYEVANVMEIDEDDFVRNMTAYPSLNELMIIADVLISDYSSVFFDYSITGKPMLHFAYDFEKYNSIRGLYFDIREYVNGAANEADLIEMIQELDINAEKEKTAVFRDKFVNYYGNAAKQSVDYIAQRVM